MLDTVVPASSAPYGFDVGCVGLVCRHELSADEHSNESRKEREAQEAEDRKGAANALSHNEFAYI